MAQHICIDQNSIVGDTVNITPAAITFPGHFSGTQFRLGRPESPGLHYFVFNTALLRDGIYDLVMSPGWLSSGVHVGFSHILDQTQ